MRREIGVHERPALPQSFLLSLQHLFAMFGSTVLVPNLLGVDPAICLLMNGIGTLLYIWICSGKIPAYLGSSFAFIAPTGAVIGQHATAEAGYAAALGGFLAAGIVFTVIALLVRAAGIGWIHVLFPPAAMGATSPSSALSSCRSQHRWPAGSRRQTPLPTGTRTGALLRCLRSRSASRCLAPSCSGASCASSRFWWGSSLAMS